MTRRLLLPLFALFALALAGAGSVAALARTGAPRRTGPIEPPGASHPAVTATPKLAYVKGRGIGDSVWLADADGRHAQRLGPGGQPVVSPDGGAVAASLEGSKGPALAIYRPGAATTRFFDLRHVSAIADSWSPDGRYLAVTLLGSGVRAGGSGVAVIDTQTGTVHTLGHGSSCGASFAPTLPARLVYALGRSSSDYCFKHVDLYTAAADGSGVQQLTHDGSSLNPVWGPEGIVFDRQKLRRHYAPIYQLWQLNADGSGARQLTHLRVPKLLEGLMPLAISSSGRRLLAAYVGQDTDEAWTVRLPSGRARRLTRPADGVLPGGLSRDGRHVLIDVGGFENPPSRGKVEVIGFGGGRAKVLVRHAGQPSWNR
jgi:hypothetical protein